jgi:hypothetical protein
VTVKIIFLPISPIPHLPKLERLSLELAERREQSDDFHVKGLGEHVDKRESVE